MAEEGCSDLESTDTNAEMESCGPCSVNNKTSVAAKFCKECKELMCTDCLSVHLSSKATKTHELVIIDKLLEHGIKLDSLTNKDLQQESCEPCSNTGKTLSAKFYCKECDEYLCSECKTVHASSKATKAHIPILSSEYIRKPNRNKSCEPCAENGKTSDATKYCKDCEEMLCNNCTKIHSSSKATKAHVPVGINEKPEKPVKTCEPCIGNGKNSVATRFCEKCDELLCDLCSKTHSSQKATKTHTPIHVDDIKTPIQRKCDSCYETKTEAPATMFCPICDKAYCDDCTNAHRNLRAFKQHTLIKIEDATEATISCEPCIIKGTNQQALYYCSNCTEYICELCSKIHTSQKATRNHKLLDINTMPESNARNCDTCKYNDTCVPSNMFCQICKEAYCEKCSKAHKAQKLTRSHELIPINEMKQDDSKSCDVCRREEKT